MFPFYDFTEYTTQEVSSRRWEGVQLTGFVPGSRLTLRTWGWGRSLEALVHSPPTSARASCLPPFQTQTNRQSRP